MQEVSTVGMIGVVIFVSALVLCIISLVFVTVMQHFLSKRLDPILFREPWFTSAELALYSSWPLSLIKSVNYMFLITYPDYVKKKKRFKSLTDVPTVQPGLKVACKMYTFTHLLTAITGVSWFLFIGWYYFFNK